MRGLIKTTDYMVFTFPIVHYFLPPTKMLVNVPRRTIKPRPPYIEEDLSNEAIIYPGHLTVGSANTAVATSVLNFKCGLQVESPMNETTIIYMVSIWGVDTFRANLYTYISKQARYIHPGSPILPHQRRLRGP